MKVVLAYLGVIAVWSTTPLGIKYSVSSGEEMAPLVARTLIGLVVTMLCLAFITERVRFSGKHLKIYASSALGIVGAMSLTYYAAPYVNSGMIAIIFGLSPMIASVLAIPLLGERTNAFQYLAICLGFTGLAWIFRAELAFDDHRWVGSLLLLAAVSCHALSGILVKRYGSGANPMATNAGSLLVALPILVILSVGADYQLVVSDLTVLKAVLYLGFFGSFLGFVLHFYVLQRLSAVKVMLIPLVTPVLALLLGFWLADEQVHYDTLVGAALIVAGLGAFFMSTVVQAE